MVRGRGGGLDGSNGQIKFVPSQSLDRENREVKLQKPRATLQNNLSTSLPPQLNYSIVAAVYLLLSSNSSSLFLAL